MLRFVYLIKPLIKTAFLHSQFGEILKNALSLREGVQRFKASRLEKDKNFAKNFRRKHQQVQVVRRLIK